MYKFVYPTKQLKLDEDLLIDYSLWRFKNDGVAKGTIRKDITAINNFLDFYLSIRIPTGIGRADKLIQFYRGLGRWYKKLGLGNKTYQRRALVDVMLHIMLDHVPGDSPVGKLIRGLLLFAKKTAFRSHNYVYTKTGGFARIKHLKFYFKQENDPRAYVIELPHSKTKQKYDTGTETRTIHCECEKVGPQKCSVHTLWELCKDRMENKHEALFLMPDGFPVTYNVLSNVLRILCEAVGIDYHYYTSHALRIGEATDRSMRGETVETIMKFVQWKHRESAMIYIRPNNVDFVKFGIIPPN